MKICNKYEINLLAILAIIIFVVPTNVFAAEKQYPDTIYIKAEQYYPYDIYIKSEVETILKIAENGFNQIKIVGNNKIKSIKSDYSRLEVSPIAMNTFGRLSVFADYGTIYVRFLKKDKPVNITITTESDITYKLLLVPTSVSEQKLTLRLSSKVSPSSSFWAILFCILIVLQSVGIIVGALRQY